MLFLVVLLILIIPALLYYFTSKKNMHSISLPLFYIFISFYVFVAIPLVVWSVNFAYPPKIILLFSLYASVCMLMFLFSWNYSNSLFLAKIYPSSVQDFLNTSLGSVNFNVGTNWYVYLSIFIISLLANSQIDFLAYGSPGLWQNKGSFPIILFFARLTRPLYIVSLVGYFFRKSKTHLIFASILFFSFLPFIVISGRRSDIFFVLISFVSVYVIKNQSKLHPYYLIMPSLFGFFAFTIVPLLRTSSQSVKLNSLRANNVIEALGNALTIFSDKLESSYAVMMMWITYESNKYDFFAPVFNKFSKQFVSSFLFGNDLKSQLTLPVYSFSDRCNASLFCSQYPIFDFWWYAPTGVLESFEMLSFAGPFVFLVISFYIFKLSSISFSKGKIEIFLAIVTLTPFLIYDGLSAFILNIFIFVFVINIVTRKPHQLRHEL